MADPSPANGVRGMASANRLIATRFGSIVLKKSRGRDFGPNVLRNGNRNTM